MGNFFWNKKYIYAAAVSGGVIFAMKYIVPLVLPFLIAGFLVVPFYPSLAKIEKKLHIKKSVSAAGMLLAATLLCAAFFWQMGSWVCGFVQDAMLHKDMYEKFFCMFVKDCSKMAESRLGVDALAVETLVLERVNIFMEDLQAEIVPKLMEESLAIARAAAAGAAFLFLTFIAVLLLAKDYETIRCTLQKTAIYRVAAKLYQKTGAGILHFVRAQLVILFIIAGICVFGLLAARISKAVPLGIFIGFMDMLPFIGTGIVLLPMAFWQLLQGEAWKAAACLILYIVCVVSREVLEPKLIGEKMGILPFYILVSIYAGLKLYGLAGVVFGPLSFILIKEIYESIDCISQ